MAQEVDITDFEYAMESVREALESLEEFERDEFPDVFKNTQKDLTKTILRLKAFVETVEDDFYDADKIGYFD